MALKCVTDIFENSHAAKRALREASILRQCDHPNVVKCKAVLRPPNPDRFSKLWMVLEHCDWDLRTVLRMNVVSWTLHLAAASPTGRGRGRAPPRPGR